MTNTESKLVISKVRDQARLTRSFDLHPSGSSADGDRIEFIPGQVAILGVPGEEPAYFAFASAPDDPDLEVLVKQKAGASRVLYDMREGDEIRLIGICGPLIGTAPASIKAVTRAITPWPHMVL